MGIPMTSSSYRRGVSGRRGTADASSLHTSFGFSSYLSRSMNSAGQDQGRDVKASSSDEDFNDDSDPFDKADGRDRRASEGSHLIKSEGKRAVVPELRCDLCGKGYKHGSCLSKHMCVLSLVQKCCLTF